MLTDSLKKIDVGGRLFGFTQLQMEFWGVPINGLINARWAPTGYKWSYNSFKQGCNPSYPFFYKAIYGGVK